jgi:hypothetical protein
MKNTHLIFTNTPDVVGLKQIIANQDKTYLKINDSIGIGSYTYLKPCNLYITNEEKPKEGDYVITPTNDIIQWAKVFQPIGKKIILTTDQNLIKNGLQAIDNKFLEWFVKNPSCEEVKVEGHIYKGQDETEYKITIPKEEVLIQSSIDGEVIWTTAKETLEEAANREVEIQGFGVYKGRWQQQAIKNSFIAGVKSDAAKEYWFEKFKKN